jgi:putative solute:sodium symporter small subunit
LVSGITIACLSKPASKPKYPMNDPNQRMHDYWKKNLRTLLILLSVWFLVSFGFGIILAEPLNSIKVSGFKLGFWFAQQGSIYTFVVLIFIYVYRMNKLDKKFDVNEE